MSPTKHGQRTRIEQALHDGRIAYPIARAIGEEQIFIQVACMGIRAMIRELYEITNGLGHQMQDLMRAGKVEEAKNWASVSDWIHAIARENEAHLHEFESNPEGRMP